VQFQTANGSSGKPSSISEGRNTAYRNIHPTVKPISLMRYLTRLVTPPSGHVLDPFAGSGSTLIGAKLEGFNATGIEMDAEYCKIAEARIAGWEEEKEENNKQLTLL
jgi:DNA modification methylase